MTGRNSRTAWGVAGVTLVATIGLAACGQANGDRLRRWIVDRLGDGGRGAHGS